MRQMRMRAKEFWKPKPPSLGEDDVPIPPAADDDEYPESGGDPDDDSEKSHFENCARLARLQRIFMRTIEYILR